MRFNSSGQVLISQYLFCKTQNRLLLIIINTGFINHNKNKKNLQQIVLYLRNKIHIL
jgi:NAD/NADP transhydrogenase beta subunit